MKQKKEKKLHLSKMTIQNLDTILEKDDQKGVKGGTAWEQRGTDVPIFCNPEP